jgi:D-cysteine desulfhydrase family pyridoxal phosphate-dependent enzyme
VFIDLPRIKLAQLPTPLHEMPRLAATLGGPRLFVKRDDLTGIVLGGNKARKLEYVLAEAKQNGADVVITTGGAQSNHCGQTAATAKMLGLDCVLVLYKGEHPEFQGNQLIDDLCDAEVHIINEDGAGPRRPQMIENIAADLRKKGRKPYIIPAGASSPLGAVGYVNAVFELVTQLNDTGITANYLFDAVGSCGTIAGLVTGVKMCNAGFKVIGVSVSARKNVLAERTAVLANETSRLLKKNFTFAPEEITIYDDYTGAGYGILTPECLQAVKLVAQTEGIMLDPVYTGKAMAGMIDLIKKGRFSRQDTVIFLHTGGAPGLFAYAADLARHKPVFHG